MTIEMKWKPFWVALYLLVLGTGAVVGSTGWFGALVAVVVTALATMWFAVAGVAHAKLVGK